MNNSNLLKVIKYLILLLLIILTIFVLIKIFPTTLVILQYIFKLFLPFIIAFILAYILQPIVTFNQRFVKKRLFAVILTLLLFVLFIIGVVNLTIPYLVKEIKELINNYDTIMADIERIINDFAKKFDFLPVDYRPTFENIKSIISSYMERMSLAPELIINKVIDYISVIVVIPMTLIYFLIDYEKIVCFVRNKLIEKNKIKLKDYLGELNRFILIFVKTTFLIMLIMMAISTFAFMIIDLDYPLFFGAIIAVTNIIPYLGPYIGGAFPVVYALIDSPQKSIVILIVIILVQAIETNIVSPYLHSRRNEIHPILVIMGLVIFGKLFGIIGMILSVPLLGIIRITMKYYPIKIHLHNETIN